MWVIYNNRGREIPLEISRGSVRLSERWNGHAAGSRVQVGVTGVEGVFAGNAIGVECEGWISAGELMKVLDLEKGEAERLSEMMKEQQGGWEHLREELVEEILEAVAEWIGGVVENVRENKYTDGVEGEWKDIGLYCDRDSIWNPTLHWCRVSNRWMLGCVEEVGGWETPIGRKEDER